MRRPLRVQRPARPRARRRASMSARSASRDSSSDTSPRSPTSVGAERQREGPCALAGGAGARRSRGHVGDRDRPRDAANSWTAASAPSVRRPRQWPVSNASVRPGTAAARRAQSSHRRQRPAPARRRAGHAPLLPYTTTAPTPSTSRFQHAVVLAGLGHPSPEQHGLAASSGRDVDAGAQERQSARPGPRRRRRSGCRRGLAAFGRSIRTMLQFSTTLPRTELPSRAAQRRWRRAARSGTKTVEVAKA